MRLRKGKAMPTGPRKAPSRSKKKREKGTSDGLTGGPLHSREYCEKSSWGFALAPVSCGSSGLWRLVALVAGA